MSLTMAEPRIAHRFYQEAWPGDFRFLQLAFVVDDLFSAAKKWVDVYGIGPFHIMKPTMQQSIYRGKLTPVDVQIAVAQAGPLQIELVHQRCDTPGVYRDVFKRGETGVHHFCTMTKNYDAAKAHYTRLGYEVATELVSSKFRVAYFDTRKDFGIITELVEETPEFREALTRISQTCANWDGKDPLRILTREGYRVPESEELSAAR